MTVKSTEYDSNTFPSKDFLLVIDSKEAAVNLYAFLEAFASPNRHFFDDQSRKYAQSWMAILLDNVEGIQDLLRKDRTYDTPSDTSPLWLRIEMNETERRIMLRVCKEAYRLIITQENNAAWIRNFGQHDYQLALDNFSLWVEVLEGRRDVGFKNDELERLLAETGRRCCLCGILHKVQVHHIIPRSEGGSDEIDNAITLCPNCHDEVHAGYAYGRTTRTYTTDELRLHRERTIALVRKEASWAPGTPTFYQDRELILFYAQCLDRPAFRTHFHQEMSFSAFDRAMEDTLLALNTGYWRTRDGSVIDRAKGKSYVVRSEWRKNLDRIAQLIEEIREKFHESVGFNEMLYRLRNRDHRRTMHEMEMIMEARFRHDQTFGRWMDEKRNEAINLLNSILTEIGHQPLRTMDRW